MFHAVKIFEECIIRSEKIFTVDYPAHCTVINYMR